MTHILTREYVEGEQRAMSDTPRTDALTGAIKAFLHERGIGYEERPLPDGPPSIVELCRTLERELAEDHNIHEQWVRDHQTEVDGAHRQAIRHVARLEACDLRIAELERELAGARNAALEEAAYLIDTTALDRTPELQDIDPEDKLYFHVSDEFAKRIRALKSDVHAKDHSEPKPWECVRCRREHVDCTCRPPPHQGG